MNLDTCTHLPAAFVVVDRDLRPLSASRKGFSVFGVRVRRGDGTGQAALDSLGRAMAEPSFGERARGAIVEAGRPGAESAFRWGRGDRSYEVSVGMLDREGRWAFVFSDVTQQIRFEETRETARRYLEDILNNVRVGVVVLNRELRVTNLNRAQEAFLHRLGVWINWVEAIGTPMEELVPQDPPERWAAIRDRVLGQGESFEEPRRTYETDDGELILSVEMTPLRDQEGKVIGAIQVSEDVTARVRLEEELREAEIVAERLEAVRETAVTVNHEINNPLATILGIAQVLLMSAKGLDEKTRTRLQTVEQEVKRIAEVTKRLQTIEEIRTDDYIPQGPKMIDIGMKRG
jgi:PAS domain S-box-containing protein